MPLSIAALKKAGVALDEKKLVTIESISAREILDSRGNPTVEVDLTTEVSTPMRIPCELRALAERTRFYACAACACLLGSCLR